MAISSVTASFPAKPSHLSIAVSIAASWASQNHKENAAACSTLLNSLALWAKLRVLEITRPWKSAIHLPTEGPKWALLKSKWSKSTGQSTMEILWGPIHHEHGLERLQLPKETNILTYEFRSIWKGINGVKNQVFSYNQKKEWVRCFIWDRCLLWSRSIVPPSLVQAPGPRRLRTHHPNKLNKLTMTIADRSQTPCLQACMRLDAGDDRWCMWCFQNIRFPDSSNSSNSSDSRSIQIWPEMASMISFAWKVRPNMRKIIPIQEFICINGSYFRAFWRIRRPNFMAWPFSHLDFTNLPQLTGKGHDCSHCWYFLSVSILDALIMLRVL